MKSHIQAEIDEAQNWKKLYTLGAIAVLGTVLVGVVEILITLLPGGMAVSETTYDWFALFQTNGFMGLRNLGLLNILFNLLSIPTYFALYSAHRRNNQPMAALSMIVSFLGVAVFLATNRAFAMLNLSQQFTLATTVEQRNLLAAAGQAMLVVGESHTPGTFLAFFLSESAGLLMSIVMLRGKIFSRMNAYAGLLGYGTLLIFEVSSSFVPALQNGAMIFALLGGISSMVWGLLTARRMIKLGLVE